MKKKSAFSILFALLASFAFCQDDAFTITLNSSVLKEPRKIMVYVPKQSNVKKQSYPVIYVFDAESLFTCTVGAV
jgi:predicted alpha/beta superfamily hydrolase